MAGLRGPIFPVLTTHIIRDIDRRGFTTLCGRTGVPNMADRSFHVTDDRFEGRVPGGAGRGIVAIRSSAYTPTTRRPCARCRVRYERGEG